MDVPHDTFPPHRDKMSTSGIKREVLMSDSDLQVDRDTRDTKGTEGGELTVCDVVNMKLEPSLLPETFATSSTVNACNMASTKSEAEDKYSHPAHNELIPSYNTQNGPCQISGSCCNTDITTQYHHAEHAANYQLEDVKKEDNTQHTEYSHCNNPDGTSIKEDHNNFNWQQLNKSEPSSTERHIESGTECDVLLCVDKLKSDDNIYHSVIKQEDEPDNICEGVDEPTAPYGYNCSKQNESSAPADHPHALSAEPSNDSSHACNMCHKLFKHPSWLKRHMLTHSGEKPYICWLCGKRFSQGNDLNRHVLTHSDQKPYCCKLCSKRCFRANELKSHTLSHYGQTERRHSCDMCAKRFSHARDLRRHMLTHSGDKSHCCQWCNKKFLLAGILKRHMLTHTGERERPHLCDLCTKRFSQPCDLKRHMLTHSGEKPHSCKLCSKRFTQASTLKTHMLSHSGEKPHPCNLCDKKFSQVSHLKTHLLTHSVEKSHS